MSKCKAILDGNKITEIRVKVKKSVSPPKKAEAEASFLNTTKESAAAKV